MAEHFDHVAEATRSLDAAWGERGEVALQIYLAEAQAHAQLAVAHELRTANLIAAIGALRFTRDEFTEVWAQVKERLDMR